MATTIVLAQFDSGLYLLGGRESIPVGTLRVATGISSVHARSMRSRTANKRIDTNPAISAARFAGNTYTVDTTGNVRRNGTIIASGLTPGSRISVTKAPPHFGASAYGFLIGGGKALKVDESGAVTNWGFAPPTTTPTLAIFSGAAVFILIDDFTSLTNLVTYASGTLSVDTVNYIISPQSTSVTIAPLLTGGFSSPSPLNLNPPNSTDFDTIQFFFRSSNPQYTTAITLQFDVQNSAFTTNFYSCQIPVGGFLGTQQAAGTTDVDNLDLATLKSAAYRTALAQQFGPAFQAFVKAQGWANIGNFIRNFHPTLGGLNNQQVNSITVTPAGANWWKVSVPRGAFNQIGAPKATNNWPNVTGYRFFTVNRSETDNVVLDFQDFTFGSPSTQQNGGGFGLLGDYSYYFTYSNSVTGHYSLPAHSGSPTSIPEVDRNAVLIAGLPTSAPDPQVDTVTVWRTLGNGGIPYRCVDIWIGAGSNFNGNFIDCMADYAGFGPTPGSVTAPIPDWTPNQTFAPGSLIQPTVGNPGAFIYIASGAGGTSSMVEPAAWNQLIGNYTTDKTVQWQNVGATLQLGLEPLELLSVQPPTTTTACAFHGGTMFVCGDSAAGARGRVYYSAVGYAEGLAGYTDISNDDDPTVGFGNYGGNLYVLTQKGIWLIVDISGGPYLPGFAASLQGTSPGTLSLQSIVQSPIALLYQAPDGTIVGFDGYSASAIGSHIMPLLHGDAVEGYPAIGSIVAATLARNEYWFSDGVGNTFAMNITPASIPVDTGSMPATTRVHGTAATALWFEPDTGKVLAGWNGGTYHLEEYGQYGTDDDTNTLPFAFRPGSFYSGDKYTAKGQRVLIDINPGGNSVLVSVSVDGVDYALGTATGSVRAKFEFPYNISGSLHGVYLTSTTGAGLIEVFRIALEVDVSGADDIGTGGGPQQQLLNALGGRSGM